MCPQHATPFRALADAFFARAPCSVWLASRGSGGKTFALGALALTEAVTLCADVNVLGGSGQQSEMVLRAQRIMWSHKDAPRQMLTSDPAKRHTYLTNGAEILALLASQRQARGAHPSRLRLDEVDEMDLDVMDAALGQQQSSPHRPGVASHVVFSSTLHNADGTMAEVLRRAKERGWPRYVWCYRETLEPHGWVTQAEIDRKRLQVSAQQWEVEHELAQPSSGARAISHQAVERAFRAELGTFEGSNGQLIEVADLPPGGAYVHGADWATVRDWSVLVTLRVDARPVRLVSFERIGRTGLAVIARHFSDRIKRMPGEALHDLTGMGLGIQGMLTEPAAGFVFTERSRAELFTEYIAALERGLVEGPRIEYLVGEHAATQEALFGGGHPPDSVVAMALAWRAASSLIGANDAAWVSVGTRKSPWRM